MWVSPNIVRWNPAGLRLAWVASHSAGFFGAHSGSWREVPLSPVFPERRGHCSSRWGASQPRLLRVLMRRRGGSRTAPARPWSLLRWQEQLRCLNGMVNSIGGMVGPLSWGTSEHRRFFPRARACAGATLSRGAPVNTPRFPMATVPHLRSNTELNQSQGQRGTTVLLRRCGTVVIGNLGVLRGPPRESVAPGQPRARGKKPPVLGGAS